jgi:hypothetical protein
VELEHQDPGLNFAADVSKNWSFQPDQREMVVASLDSDNCLGIVGNLCLMKHYQFGILVGFANVAVDSQNCVVGGEILVGESFKTRKESAN